MCFDCTLQIDKIKDELNYAPVISVDDGLEQLAATQAKLN